MRNSFNFEIILFFKKKFSKLRKNPDFDVILSQSDYVSRDNKIESLFYLAL